MQATDILFFFILLYLLQFLKNQKQFIILHFSEFNFYKVIVFIFLQSQSLIFCFNFLNTNFTIAWKIRFIFFRASICNFITAKNKKDDDNKNAFRDFSDKKISMIVFKWSSTMIFCTDSMFFSAIKFFNVFVTFSDDNSCL